MARKLPNYLKTHRKRTSLSQDEVAFLVGLSGGAKVSRYERARRLPSLETAFAYQALHDVPLRELFPGVYLAAQERVQRRAQQLAAKSGHLCKQVGSKTIAESGAPSRSPVHAQ